MIFPCSEQTVLITDGRPIEAIAATGGTLFLSLTTDTISLWHAETLLLLHSIRRVTASLESIGFNRRMYLRQDSKLLVVQTTGNALLIYDLCEDVSGGVRVYESDDAPGAPRIWLKHRQIIRVEAGIQAVCVTQDSLMISTRRPAMMQSLAWVNDGEIEPHTTMLSKVSFLPHNVEKRISTRINEIIYSARLVLFLWITGAGSVYIVRLNNGAWTGQILYHHETDEDRALLAAVNDYDAQVVISLVNGQILNFSLSSEQDEANYNALKRFSVAPASGAIRHLEWSEAGETLLVLCSRGWSLISKQGYKIAETEMFTAAADQNSAELFGDLRSACWLPNIKALMFVPMEENNLYLTNYCTSGQTQTVDTENASYLFYAHRVSLFKACTDFSENTSSAIEWAHFPICPGDAAQPIKFVHFDSNGSYLLTTGLHEFHLYTRTTQTWTSCHFKDRAHQSIIAAEPMWYRGLYVLAFLTETGLHELRLYSRRSDPDHVISSITIAAPKICLIHKEDFIYIITTHRSVHEIQIRPDGGDISFVPRRIFSLPKLELSDNISAQNTCLLHQHVPGSLPAFVSLLGHRLLLVNLDSGEGRISTVSQLSDNIEWFQVVHGVGVLKNSVFGFDGTSLKVWLNVLGNSFAAQQDPAESLSILIDFYPFKVCSDTGAIHGFELSRGSAPSEAERKWSMRAASRGYVSELLEMLLRTEHTGDALVIAGRYAKSPLFSNYMEVLLYRALEDEVNDKSGLLLRTVSLLQHFDAVMPQVIVACARKMEVSTWTTLFGAAGEPSKLYRKCIETGDLKTASAYLLVLHTFDKELEHEEVKSGHRSGNIN